MGCARAFFNFFVVLLGFLSAEALSQDYWRPLPRPTHSTLNKLCFLDSLRGWVVGDSGTILRTTNGGQTWAPQPSGVSGNLIDVFMLDDRNGWILSHELPSDSSTWLGTKLLRTTNGGVSWAAKSFRDTFYFCIVFLDTLTGWMGGEMGYIRGSSNGGGSWYEPTIDSAAFTRFPVRRIRFFSRKRGYAVGGRMDIASIIWRTTNGGKSWKGTRVGSEPLYDVHIPDSLNAVCVGGDFDFGVGVARTTSGGEMWEYVNPRVFGEARALSFRTAAEGVSPLGFTGTFMQTVDSGKTWIDRYTYDSSAVYDVAFTDSLTGYMVGERGMVLKYLPRPSAVRILQSSMMPADVRLHQNFPNPFNPQTRIDFSIPVFGVVKLKVRDILGREVATLVDGPMSPGAYSATFKDRNLASGVYFYTLQTEGFAGTKRMLLLK